MPAPVELDILPANLDWTGETGQSQSDILPGAACPSCKQVLPQESKLCVNCGFDLRTKKAGPVAAALPVATPDAPVAQPVASAEPATTATYASAGATSGRRHGIIGDDAIQGPKRGFWADAFASFIYPFAPCNLISFAIITFVACLNIGIGMLAATGLCIVLPICLMCWLFVTGWICAMYLNVVLETASGSNELPGIKMEDGLLEDVFKPLLKYVGAFACAFAPTACYAILIGTGRLSGSVASGVNLAILAVAGAFLWPMFVMLFAFNAINMVVRVDLIFTTIFRTILAYLSLWLMLLLVGVTSILPIVAYFLYQAGLNIPLPDIPDFGLIGEIVGTIIDVYLAIVSMRLIGLYYLHFKRRFTLVME